MHLLKAFSERRIEARAFIHSSRSEEAVLQPAVFMQMFAPSVNSVKTGGPFIQKFYTSEKTRMSYVDMSDYADAAAEMIFAGTYLYGTYELCSECKYSLADMESILSDLTGRDIRYHSGTSKASTFYDYRSGWTDCRNI